MCTSPRTCLPGYLNETGANWDVVSDARGHFHEPHTFHTFGLGTLAVREYLAGIRNPKPSDIELPPVGVATLGPRGRFGAVLFIEKEGFLPLFESVDLANRYDLAIMSTKGQSVVAARRLVDEMCGNEGLPLFVLHDFDKDGFSIVGMLRRSNHRHTYVNRFDVIDLGLRLADVDAEDLRGQAEAAARRKKKTDEWADPDREEVGERESKEKARSNMIANGATKEEAEFLLEKRVELNAMPSDVFIEWLEAKLQKHGVKKIVPDTKMLTTVWQRTREADLVAEKLPELIAEAEKQVGALPLPKDLTKQVTRYLRQHPEAAWDHAVAAIARGCRD